MPLLVPDGGECGRPAAPLRRRQPGARVAVRDDTAAGPAHRRPWTRQAHRPARRPGHRRARHREPAARAMPDRRGRRLRPRHHDPDARPAIGLRRSGRRGRLPGDAGGHAGPPGRLHGIGPVGVCGLPPPAAPGRQRAPGGGGVLPVPLAPAHRRARRARPLPCTRRDGDPGYQRPGPGRHDPAEPVRRRPQRQPSRAGRRPPHRDPSPPRTAPVLLRGPRPHRRVPGHLPQVRPARAAARRSPGAGGGAARPAPRPARHRLLDRHLRRRPPPAARQPRTAQVTMDPGRRFTKRYRDAATCRTALANHRWLATLGASVRLPRLLAVAPCELAFEHVAGRHATPADLVALARTLGDLHGAAHATALRHARLDRAYPTDAGHLITADGPIIVDADDLALAPFGYDLAKLVVTLAMTHGPLSTAAIHQALDAYNQAACRHHRGLGRVGLPTLLAWAEIHHILTSPYLGRDGYRHGWHTLRPTVQPRPRDTAFVWP